MKMLERKIQSEKTCTPEELFKTARSLAAQMRRTGRYPATMIFAVLQDIKRHAYSAGYREGHEEQMKARILDAQECRRKHGQF